MPNSERRDVIRLENVSKHFVRGQSKIAAISNLAANIPPGVVTGLVGPDGAGKTTLLRLMAGLLLPDSGTVTVLDRSTSDDLNEIRSSIGYMPQRFGLYEDLSVAENFQLFADLHQIVGEDLEVRRSELLRFTGLAPFTQRLAGNLSGGMKQKLGLACALLSRPAVLLLDEPSVGVDPISRRELWLLVKKLAGNETSIVWSTAYLDEAEKCDRIIVLDNGQVIADDKPGSVILRSNTRAFLMPFDVRGRRRQQRDLLGNPQIIDATLQGEQLRVVVESGSETENITSGGKPDKARLEDAVIALLRQQRRFVSRPAAVTDSVGEAHRVLPNEVISVDALSRRFGAFTAVDQVNFTVQQGEIFGLIGPNGAGKSTIFRILCGLLAPSSGSAKVAGIDLAWAPADARQRIGYMAQRFSLYGDLSVRENLRFIAGAYGLSRRRFAERLDWACEAFGLSNILDSICNTLSLGHKQRLSLAAATLHEPEILFLDEPTSGVDPLARREFWLRIGTFVENGMTILVTSHFMDEAENCDRLALIDQGHILALGSPTTLRASSVTPAQPTPSLDDAFIHIVKQSRQETLT